MTRALVAVALLLINPVALLVAKLDIARRGRKLAEERARTAEMLRELEQS